jgi:hypothetical protein
MTGMDFRQPQSLRGVFARAVCRFCCEALAPAARCEVEADLKVLLAGCIGPRSALPWSNSAQHQTPRDPCRSISALRLEVPRTGDEELRQQTGNQFGATRRLNARGSVGQSTAMICLSVNLARFIVRPLPVVGL